MMTSNIQITGEFTPDPAVCKFIVDRPVVADFAFYFKDAESGLGSPLVDRLFAIEGISAVRLAGETVTLTKKTPTAWPELAKEIGKAIREVLESGQAAVSDAAVEAARSAPTEGLEEAVRKLFDESINPALASHGGYVRLHKVEDRDLYLEMGGGCQGCAASQATLRFGIEKAVREVAPQVREIIDVTDHAAGENPYYT